MTILVKIVSNGLKTQKLPVAFHWALTRGEFSKANAFERFLNKSFEFFDIISYCSVAERALAQVNAAQGSASNLVGTWMRLPRSKYPTA